MSSVNFTKMKLVIPAGKKRVWSLLSTESGLSSWLSAKCRKEVKTGGKFELCWRGSSPQEFRVIYVGQKLSSLRLRRDDGKTLQFYLHGKMTTLTLQVTYPETDSGKMERDRENLLWAFSLANLKCAALYGLDLRHALKGRTASMGFLD